MASRRGESTSPTQILVNILTAQSRSHEAFETKEPWVHWVHEPTNLGITASKRNYQIVRIDSYSIDESVVYFFVEHNVILPTTHVAQTLKRVIPVSSFPELISKSVHLQNVLTNDGADQPSPQKRPSPPNSKSLHCWISKTPIG
jgi:hypothetical protein